MSELIKVNTDLLYRQNDPCTLTIHRSDHASGVLATGQAIKGVIKYITDEYINVLTDIPDPKGGFYSLPVSFLSIVLRDISFHVDVTPETALQRIREVINEQRENLIERHKADLAGCDNAENHLIAKYELSQL